MLKAFVPRETEPGETRCAASVDSIGQMVKAGLTVLVESGAGAGSDLTDPDLQAAGAEVVDAAAGYAAAQVVLKLHPPDLEEAQRIPEGAILISFLYPGLNPDLVEALRARQVSALAMELIPRITRAQKMDALSSQANIAGYKAVIMAADRLPKMFPLLMTAAGTIRPAHV
ncbi:MAG: NAD(P)(+) transhydrogenase (Re/Si-specific) subunit alpha, partial [Gemmatimonadetes bacterium]|nr:NAD(P)(+) transhydrogenase (Re/Si-specific) subunit alpha [Gemmatimonadota bacterium]